MKLLQKSQKEGNEELSKKMESANATIKGMIETKFAGLQTESRLVREDVKDELQLLRESHKDDTENLKEAITKKINGFRQEMKDLLKESQSPGKKQIKTIFLLILI